jgi:predicted DsbA family dithiol-disulfide isomerase
MAVESDLVTADVVEAAKFPDLARQYRVRAVPRTVVNGTGAVDGSLPEAKFVEAVLAAATQG